MLDAVPSLTPIKPLSLRPTQFARNPFTHFEVDGFLPTGTYRALDRSFPGIARFSSKTAEGKRAFDARDAQLAKFWQETPVWRELRDAFRSPQFVAEAFTLCRRATVSARGWRGLKPWVLKERAPRRRFYRRFVQPVDVTFEFSCLMEGSWIVPHTDGGSKLLSLMLYFPEDDWSPEWGGGTDYYEARSEDARRKWSNWRNEHVNAQNIDAFFADYTTMRTVGFVANRLAGFVKSADSYHGVQPIRCPAGRTRRSLNINIVTA
jgi:hypothetical protein